MDLAHCPQDALHRSPHPHPRLLQESPSSPPPHYLIDIEKWKRRHERPSGRSRPGRRGGRTPLPKGRPCSPARLPVSAIEITSSLQLHSPLFLGQVRAPKVQATDLVCPSLRALHYPAKEDDSSCDFLSQLRG